MTKATTASASSCRPATPCREGRSAPPLSFPIVISSRRFNGLPSASGRGGFVNVARFEVFGRPVKR
jgi:hypothetical protein